MFYDRNHLRDILATSGKDSAVSKVEQKTKLRSVTGSTDVFELEDGESISD